MVTMAGPHRHITLATLTLSFRASPPPATLHCTGRTAYEIAHQRPPMRLTAPEARRLKSRTEAAVLVPGGRGDRRLTIPVCDDWQ